MKPYCRPLGTDEVRDCVGQTLDALGDLANIKPYLDELRKVVHELFVNTNLPLVHGTKGGLKSSMR